MLQIKKMLTTSWLRTSHWGLLPDSGTGHLPPFSRLPIAVPIPLPGTPTPFLQRSCIRRPGPQAQAAPPSIQIGTTLTPLDQYLPGLPWTGGNRVLVHKLFWVGILSRATKRILNNTQVFPYWVFLKMALYDMYRKVWEFLFDPSCNWFWGDSFTESVPQAAGAGGQTLAWDPREPGLTDCSSFSCWLVTGKLLFLPGPQLLHPSSGKFGPSESHAHFNLMVPTW